MGFSVLKETGTPSCNFFYFCIRSKLAKQMCRLIIGTELRVQIYLKVHDPVLLRGSNRRFAGPNSHGSWNLYQLWSISTSPTLLWFSSNRRHLFSQPAASPGWLRGHNRAATESLHAGSRMARMLRDFTVPRSPYCQGCGAGHLCDLIFYPRNP